jgi:hypothetical protein
MMLSARPQQVFVDENATDAHAMHHAGAKDSTLRTRKGLTEISNTTHLKKDEQYEKGKIAANKGPGTRKPRRCA